MVAAGSPEKLAPTGASAAPQPAPCQHCGLPVPQAGERFCCRGCEAVHGLLHQEGLERYYELAGGAGCPVPEPRDDRADRKWLEPIEARVAAAPGQLTRVRLDIQGMHCAACVWLLEELFRRQGKQSALRIDVNPALGAVDLLVKKDFPLREYVVEVERFGYRLGPALKRDSGASSELLWRLGICVALSMNAMIFAFAIYAGLEHGPLRTLFDALIFGITTASVAVGGSVFIRSAWAGLRRRILHLDLPIALGVILAYGSSLLAYAAGRDAIYFDTLTVFIALMLLGRFLQERVLERNRRQLLDSDGAEGLWTRRLRDGAVELVRCPAVRAGDELLVAPGDLVCVDAVLADDEAACSLDWINGESAPRAFGRGDTIPAGAFNVGKRPLRVVAASDFAAGALTDLLRTTTTRAADAARATPWWRKVSRVYVATVLGIAAVTIGAWILFAGDPAHALEVGAAVLIVTCPCAFGIATPLAYELAQAGLRRAGLFVRAGGFLDRAVAVRRVVFDKTGTLTTGALRLVDESPLDALSADEQNALYTLAASSTHPKSAAVATALARRGARFLPTLAAEERAGKGVEGGPYRLGAPVWAAAGAIVPTGTDLAFSCEGLVLCTLRTDETLRVDAAAEVAALRDDGYDVAVLSGDTPAATAALADRLGLPEGAARGGASPHDKATWLALHDHGDTLMIGDGLNDAVAVEKATCSGTPAVDRPFLPARSDFYFTTPGLRPVRLALRTARTLAKVNRRNLTIAVLYNVLTVGLAAAGLMSPLLCAVVMPVSSLTVVLATTFALSRRSALWKS